MENQLVWDKRFEIGVDTIDDEHKKLFRTINKLFALGEQEEKSQWVCQEAVKYFKNHALQHFADEEDYMASVGYADLEMHKYIHENFRRITLPALENELEQTGYSKDAMNHFLGVCTGWLIGHTLIEDQAIVSGETIKHWGNFLPEEEQDMMEQTILSQLHNMFQLDSKLISNCYGGEKFGDGIYYRLIYNTKNNKKAEFFLVFEEKLIVSTMSSMFETKSKTVSVMLMNMARYTAKQFVEHIKEHFSSLDQAEVKAEHLLTYEQFQKAFENHSPQFSLLFDTGKGYFAYCMDISDTLPNEEDGTFISNENAMEQVEKYLDQSKIQKAAISNQKKILVVDDSAFMLKTMQELLGKYYDVSVATSGLSALRSIILNKPDLVLLDYEMPVCNGNQILAMLRSEKEFADTPVVFLTSNVDKKSVEKVLELKPQGYLSKLLPLETLKRRIDVFFEK